jgi:hypothetical protein
VQTLQDFVNSQHGFSVFQGRPLNSQIELLARIARRQM